MTDVTSKDDGYMPSGTGSGTTMTRDGSLSCGMCHSTYSKPSSTVVTVTPSARVFDLGQTINIRVDAEDSTVGSNAGGFAADVSDGQLIAGSTSRVRSDGLAITHQNRDQRTWSFNYKAPTTAGLIEFYTVGMAANRNGSASGDKFAFHGSDPANMLSTPVRLYANAPAVTAVGKACDDGYGNYSVLGAATTPTIGQTFRLEAFGLPPASTAMLMAGIGPTTPGFDMAPMGAPGCVLWTTMDLQILIPTSTGNAERSEGKVILPTQIPNDPNLRGVVVSMQVMAIDKNPKRPFPLIVTNAVQLKIQ